ncbi:ribonuclease III [Methylobacillus sp. MM3]|uniref:ribonuclease III n=1 Tax=Methylobacillus sp. MM3 TaxID=1848039 RepID=UPI0007DE9955|nr:ribonuclease III [Methylobacillus sp. MM3]OAJ70985.1 ribonuclease III [Methylobacillus sp. MM3]
MTQSALVRYLGHDFTNNALLIQALTHRSHSVPNNERLEFLGDGVLNCVIAHLLYRRFPKLPEGELSRLRAHLVREATLCEIALGLSLGEYMRLGEGEMKSGGWRRPSMLADTLEALLGAVFLDAGFPAAEAVVERLYSPLLENLDPKSLGKDPKTFLQEYLQGRKLALPEYVLLATEGEAHCQVFRVECRIPALKVHAQGAGNSRRAAEQQAAQAAYELLK